MNNVGSYECNCIDGYKKPANGNNVCKDVDECSDGTHNCHEFANCGNFPGSFECSCKDGTTGDGTACEQVNECEGENNCDPNASCTDLDFTYECSCNTGYTGDGDVTGDGCTDDDECALGSAECPENSSCANNEGSYECNCDIGYKKPDNGNNVCKDIDECQLDTVENVCGDVNAICTNNVGSYECVCRNGFGRSIVCPDINECDLGTHNCNANAACTNNEGSFDCNCDDGFEGDGVACDDVDECTLGTAECPDNSSCVNNAGSYECECNDGYQKPANGNNICKDIDECTQGTADCTENSTCANNEGGFDCVCDEGFDLNADNGLCESSGPIECGVCEVNQVCDDTTGTCICKPGFIEDADGCSFDFSVCPTDNPKDMTIRWSSNSFRQGYFEGDHGVVGRIQIPGRNELEAYSAFLGPFSNI